MRTNAIRKSNVSNERVIALDELLPKKSIQYDSAPGVYVRTDKERELDILWQGYRINSKEEKSPWVYLATGFAAGIVSMLIFSALLNLGNPSHENSDLKLWKKSNTKSPLVSVTPSAENAESINSKTEYQVKNGDTLGGIAYKFYGTGNPSKVNKIQEANNLTSPDQLKIGQKLIIPIEE